MSSAGVLVGLGAMTMSRLGMLFGSIMAPVSMLMRGFAMMMGGGLMIRRSVVMVFHRRVAGC